MNVETSGSLMPITRTRVLIRAKYGWPRKSVHLDQTKFHQPDGYRMDPAGYVSMCWDIPLTAPKSVGGMTTVTLLTEGWAKEIAHRDLQPGDAIGYLGTDSVDGTGGLIVIFDSWVEPGTALTWEFHRIVDPGPDQRSRPVDFRWHAYRFRDIVNG